MDPKTAARETIGSNAQTLVGLSHRVHAHPELKFEEEQSSAWTAGVLADAGLTVAEIDAAFAKVAEKNAALLVSPDALFTDWRAQLVTLATKHAVPTIYPLREYTEIGGLIRKSRG